MTCEGKCTDPPNKGIRSTWWCGFSKKGHVKDHEEHDHYYRGKWYHCYG